MFHGPFLVDAHVHFYDVYDRARFFEGALTNFQAAAATLGLRPEPAGLLLFTETARDHYFRRFRAEADGDAGGPWTFRRTEEDDSLLACPRSKSGAGRDGGAQMLLVAGRQVATRDGLEVLALACDAEFPDGRALRETLEAVLAADALAVLPWGFGKWWLGRGRLMADLVATVDPRRVFLGDNSGRPGLLPGPRLFAQARARDIQVLPGTDPLPFASEAGKAGAFGFVLEGGLDPARPAAALKELLRSQRERPRPYGRLETPWRFLDHQVRMQLRKRL